MTLALMTVRQEVNNFESSAVVQELEFAMNLTLYVILIYVALLKMSKDVFEYLLSFKYQN